MSGRTEGGVKDHDDKCLVPPNKKTDVSLLLTSVI
ncbi:hypothetical protein X729_21330 [Mesorhizobium sp. L103C131B0]|nr:hypothetical protein X729_21330 [Mesorhizobium sp. L103C131B0]